MDFFSKLFGKRHQPHAYLIILYVDQPPSSQEQDELANGIAEQSGMPVSILELMKVAQMPTSPENREVATFIAFACHAHKIPFNSSRDEIAFRTGMGLGVVTITIKA